MPDFRALARETWDAIVVGAGPAGSVAAGLLAARGWRVLLLDRASWPRDKACGGCVNAAAAGMLRELGFAEALAGATDLTTLVVNVAGRRLKIPMSTGSAVARAVFDGRLVDEAIRRGVVFNHGVSAKLLSAEYEAPFRTVGLSSPKESDIRVHAKVVVACDGLRGSLLNSEAGAAWHTAPASRIGISVTVASDAGALSDAATVGMCVSRDGYVGLVRRPGGLLHVGASVDPAACNRARGPMHVVRRILDDCGIELEALNGADFEGTCPLTGHRNVIAGHRVLAIGDACGYVEPFTGEGISWAIRGARAACSLLPNDLAQWPGELAKAWGALHRREIIRRQAWCRWLRQIVKRPRVAAACINTGRWLPWAPAMMARRISA